MEHISNTELQEYLDRLLDQSRNREVEAHLGACAECSSRLKTLERLGAAISKVPLERVSDGFTERVMAAVGITSVSGLFKQVARNFLPLAGVLVILLLLVGLFSGQEETPLTQQGKEYAQTYEKIVGEALSTGLAVLLDWVQKAVGFSASIPFIRLLVGLSLVFALIALFDEFVFLPMMKKKN